MTYHEKMTIFDYIADTVSSDPGISDANLRDLLVLNFALTPDEARDVLNEWRGKAVTK